jgi:hypothetical protein
VADRRRHVAVSRFRDDGCGPAFAVSLDAADTPLDATDETALDATPLDQSSRINLIFSTYQLVSLAVSLRSARLCRAFGCESWSR